MLKDNSCFHVEVNKDNEHISCWDLIYFSIAPQVFRKQVNVEVNKDNVEVNKDNEHISCWDLIYFSIAPQVFRKQVFRL